MEGSIRFSRKREAILAKIRSVKSHPSAEWVYGELKREMPDISLGTVYRNIAMFKREGAIMSVAVVGGEERFDGNAEEHAHFVCEHCGAVIDIEDEPGEHSDAVADRYGVTVTRRTLIYYGACEKCREC